MMEPLTGPPAEDRPPKILAHAPVKLWNGLFTIRARVIYAGRELDGRFLIDSAAPISILSPVWLRNQGILPAFIEVPGAVPRRPEWSPMQEGERELAPLAKIDELRIGTMSVPVHEFLLHTVDFFEPPESIGPCCDGILGLDFLRNYSLRFQSFPHSEIQIWDPAGFHLGSQTPWTEVEVTERGDLTSRCGYGKLEGVRWDTASEQGMVVTESWKSAVSTTPVKPHARGAKGAGFSCENAGTLAESVLLEAAGGPGSNRGLLALKNPALDVGMLILGRGDFTFDLPHGRIWFSSAGFSKALPENRSGLRVEYAYSKDGDRILVVKALAPKSPAVALKQAGLKVGTVIEQIDGKDAGDFDEWEVNRRLGGSKGQSVGLAWKAGHAMKFYTFKVAGGEKPYP
jgi:hypothetical protein